MNQADIQKLTLYLLRRLALAKIIAIRLDRVANGQPPTENVPDVPEDDDDTSSVFTEYTISHSDTASNTASDTDSDSGNASDSSWAAYFRGLKGAREE